MMSSGLRASLSSSASFRLLARPASSTFRRWSAARTAWAGMATDTEAATEDKIPMPTGQGQDKVYSKKISDIVDQIAQLNLLEVADLNSLLKQRLNIR